MAAGDAVETMSFHFSSAKSRLVALAAALAIAAVAAGCGSSDGPRGATAALPGAGRPPVTIGDKNFTEQFILGELYDLALSAQGYSVVLDKNIGTTQITLRALASGKLNMYPEYLNVFDSQIAGYRRSFRSVRGAYRAAARWARRHGLALLAPTPFDDTVGIGVLSSYAQAHGLTTLASLQRVAAQLTLGVPPQFAQSPSGLPALERAYDLRPAHVVPIYIGSQYQALEKGAIEAAYVRTTDGELTGATFRVLGDPRQLFGVGNVVPVVTARTLAAEGPDFARTIERVDRLLSTPVMRELNAEVDLDGKTPQAVAQSFLQQHGLIPPASSSS
ncbi:MAG TPA: glycine betaine ABC transporter substrate-binding protein [Dehalococcoidia bacterium]|nr:glycine betaine ABC transporter substrate-binding protein [Dehalococcoidia bacterium]